MGERGESAVKRVYGGKGVFLRNRAFCVGEEVRGWPLTIKIYITRIFKGVGTVYKWAPQNSAAF